MASQRLSIAKIGGEAARATIGKFRRWSSERLVEDANEWSAEQWPEHIRDQADAWATDLERYRDQPPVLFYVEYIDTWSFCPPLRHIGQESLIQVIGNEQELFCLPLPMEGNVLDRLKHARVRGQWGEDRLFATLVLEAASAWDEIVDTAALVFLRKVTGGAIDDHQIKNSLAEVPEWMKPI